MEQFDSSLRESFQVLADYAAKKNIRLILRQSVGRTPDTLEGLQLLVQDVNRPNFTLNKPTTHKLTERFSAQLGGIYKKTARLTGTGTGRAGHSKTGEQKCQGLDR